ncbi:MAG TPA: hypothetical protein VEW28_05805, partial [Candidatus Kapabacteria bacterium]|nr:hypothetical protein [Candidatus Kapabacteria bacterium]
MMKYIPILLILLAAASRAQPPRIDSLSVDEWSGTLYLHGDFGSNQGVVTCDNVTLPITSWSDSLIATSIPDTGRGSCGPVIVGARGYKSVSRIISLLSGKWWYEPKSISTNDGKQWTLISGTYSLVFSFRFDLRPIIVGNSDVILNIHPKRQTLLEIIFLGGVYAGGGNG